MAISLASTDVNYPAQALVTQLQAAVTANANPVLLPGLTAALDLAQQALVNALMANAASRTPAPFGQTTTYLTASNILASRTINT